MLSTGDSLPAKPSIGRSSSELNAISVSRARRSRIVRAPRQSVPATAPAYAFFASLAFMAELPDIAIMPNVLYAMNTSAETGQSGDMRPGVNPSVAPLWLKSAFIVSRIVAIPITNSTGTISLKIPETRSKSPRTVKIHSNAIMIPPTALFMPNCWLRSDPPAAVMAMIME